MAGDEDDVQLPRYMYVDVAENLAGRIQSGEIPVGAKLPGERELADEYEVSTDTVRRAVRLLRSRGLVATLAVKGTYVIRRRPSE